MLDLKAIRKNIFSRNSSMDFVTKCNTKKYAQKSSQRSTISILIFLIFIIKQNVCLNFFKTAFELLLYRKCGKKV